MEKDIFPYNINIFPQNGPAKECFTIIIVIDVAAWTFPLSPVLIFLVISSSSIIKLFKSQLTEA